MTKQPKTRRWEPLVKITHWGIGAVVLWNALIVGKGSVAHIYAGYVLAGLLAVRLLWGVIGTRPARFSAFPPSPARAFAHMRAIRAGEHESHVSHNPLGALMAYAIWGTVSVIVASGIAQAGAPPAIEPGTSATQLMFSEVGEHEGDEGEEHEDEASSEGGEAGEVFEEVHEVAVNLIYVLILLHISGVAFETARSGRRTILAMLPGGK